MSINLQKQVTALSTPIPGIDDTAISGHLTATSIPMVTRRRQANDEFIAPANAELMALANGATDPVSASTCTFSKPASAAVTKLLVSGNNSKDL